MHIKEKERDVKGSLLIGADVYLYVKALLPTMCLSAPLLHVKKSLPLAWGNVQQRRIRTRGAVNVSEDVTEDNYSGIKY